MSSTHVCHLRCAASSKWKNRDRRCLFKVLPVFNTFKILYQSINNTRYLIATVPTKPLSRVYHIPTNNTTMHISFRLLTEVSLVEVTPTTSFPNENHPCRTLTHCTPSRGNPLMSRRDINSWTPNNDINPLMTSILSSCLQSFVSSRYILSFVHHLTCPIWVTIGFFFPVWPWNLTDDLEKW